MDDKLLSILACPKCCGDLSATGEEATAQGLLCNSCAVVYPVEDGIPVLLVEEAVALEDWKARTSA